MNIDGSSDCAASAGYGQDHNAILARVEQMIDLLRTRYICAGWKMDEDGAKRTLVYFRRHVEGPPFRNEDEDTEEYQHACDFIFEHGQSLDWINRGNPVGLICGMAGHSPRATRRAPTAIVDRHAGFDAQGDGISAQILKFPSGTRP